MSHTQVLIIGGGAAGYFGAIHSAESPVAPSVRLVEAGAQTLAKVRVSGGGRCNVTHACWEPRELIKRYPRGSRELLGAFSRWQPKDTVAWFNARGVELKTEADGRMFPTTDDSSTIVECLRTAARQAKVTVDTQANVRALRRRDEGAGFQAELASGEIITCDRVLLASGGNKAAHDLAAGLGHTIEPPVPSLFTFNCKDARLDGLAGLAVPLAQAEVVGSKLAQEGPLLITHWGVSGPAILKLSAWGARDLAALQYRFTLRVNWLGKISLEQVKADLQALRVAHPKRLVHGAHLPGVPSRLWERFVAAAGVAPTVQWAGLGNAALQAIAQQIAQGEFEITGKSTNKEEFVTCGGVRLREVDFKTMESRLCPGLYFAGEVLDVDGITGGFNFQAAWTTGFLAGTAIAASLA